MRIPVKAVEIRGGARTRKSVAAKTLGLTFVGTASMWRQKSIVNRICGELSFVVRKPV